MRLFSLPCILMLGRSYTGAMTGSVYSFVLLVFVQSCFLATSRAQEELCEHKKSGIRVVKTLFRLGQGKSILSIWLMLFITTWKRCLYNDWITPHNNAMVARIKEWLGHSSE